MKGRSKFLVGGLLILAAVVYLIASSANATAEYFMGVESVLARQEELVGKKLRISGAVIGETIQYDPDTLMLTFVVAHVPESNAEIEAQGGLAEVLHKAVNDPNRARLKVVYHGVKPDLLTNEAQAIMTGTLGEDGVFYATELLLKCPTRYEEALPEQAQGR